MTESAVYLQPAFILQQRKYRETSLIIDALTRDFGRISLLAKGVRKSKSKTAGILQPFIPLAISYVGKAELKTLTDVERCAGSRPTCGIHSIPGDCRTGSRPVRGIHSIPGDIIQPLSGLKGLALYCGFYINELVVYFLHKYDPHPEVFSYYSECLSSLADGSNIEAALRLFELNLVECAGYGLQLEYDNNEKPIEPLKRYDFNVGQGPVEAVNGRFSGKTLLALSARELTEPQVLSEAKILMRMVIDVYLQGRELKSRAVISKVFATAQQVDERLKAKG
ncbi:MAG TPA: DNA repair protein RecO [Methylobacter sp.]|jgi:DNA repair protein RecO (recombination protein O)